MKKEIKSAGTESPNVSALVLIHFPAAGLCSLLYALNVNGRCRA